MPPESPHIKGVGVPIPKLADTLRSYRGAPSHSTAGVTCDFLLRENTVSKVFVPPSLNHFKGRVKQLRALIGKDIRHEVGRTTASYQYLLHGRGSEQELGLGQIQNVEPG